MSKWFSFSSGHADLAPDGAGVYELACKEHIVYIGSSETSIRAIIQKRIGQKTFGKVTHFRFCKTDPGEAQVLENKLCLEFKKRYYRLPSLQKTAPIHKKSNLDDILWC
jgi:hypothetical protein